MTIMNKKIKNRPIAEIINLKNNFFIYIFFIAYFVLGISIFKDFGISFDENINRTNGFVSLNYIIHFFGLDVDLDPFYKNIPSLTNYIDREYGVVFDLPAAFFEVVLGLNNIKDIYLLRHLMTFLIFYLSSLCFFFLCEEVFKDKIIALIGFAFLIFSPRIFAESFYNSKDIIFLSFLIFSIHFNIKFLNLTNNKNIFFAAFFSALMANVRIVGIFVPLLTFFFYFFHTGEIKNKKKIYSFVKYLIIYLFILILFWPFLWENSFKNLVSAVIEFANYPWLGQILYNGEYLSAKFIPWHYFIFWFFMTTPLIFFLIIFSGFLLILKTLFQNLIKIEDNKYKNLWNNKYEMISLYIFFIFFTPLFFIILFDSTLYTGWRQLYFLYPPLIILGLYFLSYIKKISYLYFKLILIIFVIQLLLTSSFMIKYHPHQHLYFNKISNIFFHNKFEQDYWGVSNHTTLMYLLDKKEFEFPIKISAASFTDLNKTKLILGEKYKNKFEFVEDNHDKADFIFTNYYYYKNPKFNKKRYNIPKNFKSYYKLKIGEKTINELYINTLK